jgi:hypothetical protein
VVSLRSALLIIPKLSGLQVLAPGPGGRKALPYDPLLTLLSKGLGRLFILARTQRAIVPIVIWNSLNLGLTQSSVLVTQSL